MRKSFNDAHVAALARLDQAKTNVQAVKAANRQAMQVTRDQGQYGRQRSQRRTNQLPGHGTSVKLARQGHWLRLRGKLADGRLGSS